MIKYNNSNSNNRINNIYYNNKYSNNENGLISFSLLLAFLSLQKKKISLASLQNTSAVHGAVQYWSTIPSITRATCSGTTTKNSIIIKIKIIITA